MRTGLGIHLYEERRSSYFSEWNGDVEKEDRQPGRKEELPHVPGLFDDACVVSEAMQHRNNGQGLRYESKGLQRTLRRSTLKTKDAGQELTEA